MEIPILAIIIQSKILTNYSQKIFYHRLYLNLSSCFQIQSSTNELTDLNLLFIAADLEFLQIGERIRTKSIGSLIILQRGERVRTKRIGSLIILRRGERVRTKLKKSVPKTIKILKYFYFLL